MILIMKEAFPLVMRIKKEPTGKFSKWEVGELVLARRDEEGGTYSIKKLKTDMLALTSCMAFVPRSYLEKVPCRNISFMLTQPQVKTKTKDVTRRDGWEHLKKGDILWGVEKGQGLKKGEKIQRMALIRVVDARREPLERMFNEFLYGLAECNREGFPNLHPEQFIEMFCSSHKGCKRETQITRIEFEYLT